MSTNSGRGKTKLAGRSQPQPLTKRRRTNNSDEVEADFDLVTVKEEKMTNQDEAKDCNDTPSLFGSIIKAAASMNPQQFELPQELIEPITFPGIHERIIFLCGEVNFL